MVSACESQEMKVAWTLFFLQCSWCTIHNAKDFSVLHVQQSCIMCCTRSGGADWGLADLLSAVPSGTTHLMYIFISLFLCLSLHCLNANLRIVVFIRRCTFSTVAALFSSVSE